VCIVADYISDVSTYITSIFIVETRNRGPKVKSARRFHSFNFIICFVLAENVHIHKCT
jgi:hypothetical protein